MLLIKASFDSKNARQLSANVVDRKVGQIQIFLFFSLECDMKISVVEHLSMLFKACKLVGDFVCERRA